MKQDTLKPIVILVVLILTSINPIKAQWTYSELNQLKTDVTISYDVIYERNLNKQKVNFIAIALDPAYKIAAFLKENKFNYDIIPEGRYYKDKFDIPSYPTNIVIDQKGIIKMYETGYKNDIIERMSYEIEKALKI